MIESKALDAMLQKDGLYWLTDAGSPVSSHFMVLVIGGVAEQLKLDGVLSREGWIREPLIRGPLTHLSPTLNEQL